MNAILLALHLLAVTAWVGGMFFALVVLRPSLVVLEPRARLALHRQVFRRFFLVVWHAMPVTILSGLGMVWTVYGGFAQASPWVHLMALGGIVMAGIFIAAVFRPWRELKAALDDGDAARAVAAVDRVRRLVQINLGLGVITIVFAALAAAA
ncbi:MAG TPA: CopD family protein [Acetobacteraceae bacterium]|nr:CopD family protein [Acetobacteraceae bacterium]